MVRLPLVVSMITYLMVSPGLSGATEPQGVTPDAPAGPSRGGRAQARVTKVRPTNDSEKQFDEVFVVSDGHGHRRAIVSGRLPTAQPEELFWIIDPSKQQYHVLRLTSNAQGDAKRIRNLFRRFGVELSDEYVAAELTKNNRVFAKDIQDFKDNYKAQPGNQFPPLPEGPCFEFVGGPHESADAQWVRTCRGYGYADIQTWEPAKRLFNVNHLAETYVSAQWTHDTTNSSFPVLITAGSCWANPQTFINTHWIQLFCFDRPQVTRTTNGFDASMTGQYQNWDFIYQFGQVFGIFIPYAMPITVSSTAAVQMANGSAIWGWDHWEDYPSSYPGLFESLLITAKWYGEAAENDCTWDCQPSDRDLSDCEYLNMTSESQSFHWDYAECMCLGGASPIIIDVANDGIRLTSASAGVTFDILGTGVPARVAWTDPTSPDDAFLVLDRNGNGTIDSAAELFGNFTPQPPPKGKAVENGFLALAVYDDPKSGGNGDGQITEDDAIYLDLRLWTDRNHDGISQPGELQSLDQAGVRAIMLHYVTTKQRTSSGMSFDSGATSSWTTIWLIAAR